MNSLFTQYCSQKPSDNSSANASRIFAHYSLSQVQYGAPWIADQIAQRFGEPGRYLLDFYHLCDYLADASVVCAPENPQAWLEQQRWRLKHNFVEEE